MLKLFAFFIFTPLLCYAEDARFHFKNGNFVELTFFGAGSERDYQDFTFHKKNVNNTENGRFRELIGDSIDFDTMDHVLPSPGNTYLILQTETGMHVINQKGEVMNIPLPDEQFQSKYGEKLKRRHWEVRTKSLWEEGRERVLIELPFEGGSKSEYYYITKSKVKHLGTLKSNALDTFQSADQVSEYLEKTPSQKKLYLPEEAHSTEKLAESLRKTPSGTPVLSNYHVPDAELKKYKGNPWYQNHDQHRAAIELQNLNKTIRTVWEYRFQAESFKMELYESIIDDYFKKLKKYYKNFYPEATLEKLQINGEKAFSITFPEGSIGAQRLKGTGIKHLLAAPTLITQEGISAAISNNILFPPIEFILNPAEISPSFEHEIHHAFLTKMKSPLSLSFDVKKGKLPNGPGLGNYAESFFSFQELSTFKVTLIKLRIKLKLSEQHQLEESFRKEIRDTIKNKLKIYERIIPFAETNLAAFKSFVSDHPAGHTWKQPFTWISDLKLKVEVELGVKKKAKTISREDLLKTIAHIEAEMKGDKKFLSRYQKWVNRGHKFKKRGSLCPLDVIRKLF